MKRNTRHIGKVVTFGEVLMRLSPAENRKLQQSNQMDFFFGGTEMNVAASLCQFGLQCLHVTNVSNDLVGDAAIASMRQLGINVRAVNRVDHPLGLYFLEVGSSARSSKIAYNRLHGAFANITEDTVNWEDVLEDCSHFHWTGITPAIATACLLLRRFFQHYPRSAIHLYQNIFLIPDESSDKADYVMYAALFWPTQEISPCLMHHR